MADATIATPAPRPSLPARFNASPAQVVALAVVALFLLAFLIVPIVRVIFVEALHYFPFILLNLSASLANIDTAMEESAQNLGAHGFTLFRRIVFPLALPGYLAGAALVFVKTFDDLATPLLLNVTNMLAPQAYLKITSVGISDPMGYVISVIMILCSVGAMALAGLTLR